MKMLLLMCAVTTVLMADAAPQLNDKFGESSKCKPCHAEKVKEWSGLRRKPAARTIVEKKPMWCVVIMTFLLP